jgi:hypothetical protein
MMERATLLELELRYLEGMTRPQLLEALRECVDCLPPDLAERVEEHTADRLRLLVCAARLIHALRQLQKYEDFREKGEE